MKLHGIYNTDYIVLDLGYMVHGFESMGYLILRVRVHGFEGTGYIVSHNFQPTLVDYTLGTVTILEPTETT